MRVLFVLRPSSFAITSIMGGGIGIAGTLGFAYMSSELLLVLF